MPVSIALSATLLLTLAVAEPEKAHETVVFRAAGGRFLRVEEDGSVSAAALYPVPPAEFDLSPLPSGCVTLRAGSGQFLVAAGPGGRHLRAESLQAAPGAPGSFLVVPVDGNRVALKPYGREDLILFEGSPAKPPDGASPTAPRPGATVEIYRFREIPEAIRTALGGAVLSVINRELGDKQYDKVRTEKTERYVTLPAPTLRNPGRKKRHQVLGVAQEFHVRARLAGRPGVCITHMPYLTGYRDPKSTLILFVVDATLPVQGHVSYKVPKLLSATTGYQSVVALKMVGELPIRKADDQISFGPPELRLLDVSMHRLDLSNDILQTVRRPIERTINGELRKNNARIRAEANRELRKAVDGQAFRHPLLRYLTIP